MKYSLKATVHAELMIANGFVGNGCGTGLFMRMACNTFQRIVRVDFRECVRHHDAEYTIPAAFKSPEHKLIADAYFEYNCRLVAGGNSRAVRLAQVLHTALLWGGTDAYWDGVEDVNRFR